MPESLRIASLISSATEMLYALGLGDSVVGVSHECDYPAEVAEQPRLTRSRIDSAQTSQQIDEQVKSLLMQGEPLYEVDVERLVSLQPDVIITQSQCDVCAVRYADVEAAVNSQPALQQSRLISLNPQSLADMLDDIRRIGAACSRAATATSLTSWLQARVDAIRAKTETLSPADQPRVACIEWIEPTMIAGNWTPQLVDWAGGQGGLSIGGQHSQYTDWAAVVEFDPQVIAVMPCGFDLARTVREAARLKSFPHWSELSAVRNQRAFAVDGNAFFNRCGPRLVESMELLAHLVQPQLCGPPAMLDPAHSWQRID